MGFFSHKHAEHDAESEAAAGWALGSASVAPQRPHLQTVSEEAAKSTLPMNDILLRVPAAEVHQVNNHRDELLARAELVAYGVVYPTGETRMAMEVGDARWWLLPETAALKVAPTSYMFCLADNVTFYLLTFAEDTAPEAIGAFEGLIEEICAYRKSEALMEDPTVASADYAIAQQLAGVTFQNKRANSISSAGAKMASGILLMASQATEKIANHSAQVQASSEPTATPHSVPFMIKGGAATMRTGTKLISKTAGKVVSGLASIPVFVVDKLTHSKPPPPGEPLKPQSTSKQFMTAGAVSFTMVYSAMEEGAKLVLNGSRTSAASVVTHKYGPDYGKLTDDTMASGAHAVNAYTSIRNVAVKAVAKQTAKSTAKRMLASYVNVANSEAKDHKGEVRRQIRERAQTMRHDRADAHDNNKPQHKPMAAGDPLANYHAMSEAYGSRVPAAGPSTRTRSQTGA